MNTNDEFYIGWMPEAPSGFSIFIKRVVSVLLVSMLSLCLLLALRQKKFSTAVFEYGKSATIKGLYSEKPVPSLKIAVGRNFLGTPSFMTIPLVGYGKHGAQGIMAEIGAQSGSALNGLELSLKGTLLYHNGRGLLQIDKSDSPLIAMSKPAESAYYSGMEELGFQSIKGEIVDPKCFFGVMKPGEGKPHRDCAIRCISGGIPAVLLVKREDGETDYYIISGNSHEITAHHIQDFIGEPIEIKARVFRQDDWKFIRLDNQSRIKEISKRDLLRDDLNTVACATDCKM